ncbi:MAG: hypothetical protein ACFFDN_19270 [Candidatus Hodarchaeota archaeon]
MIQKIIMTFNGIPIITRDYVKKSSIDEMRQDLVSPYISSISSFAKQVHNDNIEAIVMGNIKLFYRELKIGTGVTVLVTTDREDENLEINSRINLLVTHFQNSYTSKDLDSWNGDASFFYPFYLVLDDIAIGDIGKIKEDFKAKFQFTAKLLKNNFDKIVNSIILGEKIIIVGKKDQLEIIIPILDVFSYGKVLKTIIWSEKEQDADILGVSHANFKYFDLKWGKVVVDLIKSKIFGGTSDAFCKSLIKDLKGLSYDKALRLINSRMQMIYSKLNTILILSQENQLDNKMLDLILKDVDKNAKTLIVKLMGTQIVGLFDLIQKYGLKERSF